MIKKKKEKVMFTGRVVAIWAVQFMLIFPML